MRDMTTKEVAEKYEVDDQTVRRWCREGKFAGAYQLPIKTGSGQVWLIPKKDLENFQKPDKGRPQDENPSSAALLKRERRKSGKKN